MAPIRRGRPGDAARLFEIWRGAVLVTHGFIAPSDLADIERMFLQRYLPRARLWVAVDGGDRPLAFMGVSGAHIDALFVDPVLHRTGLGRRLVEHARRAGGELTVDVSEQNEGGRRFYASLGFAPFGRSATDEGGRPYPLLHLRLPEG